MLTRFSKPTCPRCGHTGRPEVKGETANPVLSLIPVIGDIADAKDAANRTLHCAKCGEPLTQSLREKAVSLKDSIRSTAAHVTESIQNAAANRQLCMNCGSALPPDARFCAKCGTAK